MISEMQYVMGDVARVNRNSGDIKRIIDVREPNGVLAVNAFPDDEGIGFYQGSTDGVVNTYLRGGFLRDQLPEVDRGTRNRFNLQRWSGIQCGSDTSPYTCHYNPDPYYDEHHPNDSVWSDSAWRDDYAKPTHSSAILAGGSLVAAFIAGMLALSLRRL